MEILQLAFILPVAFIFLVFLRILILWLLLRLPLGL
jgi:hypothetical protein